MGKIPLLPAFLLLVSALSPLPAATSDQTWENHTFLVHHTDPKTESVRLFWKDETGRPLENFSRLRTHCTSQGLHLRFAMNAGIFGTDLAPLGLHVENNQTRVPLNTRRGAGNFFFQPNGVFLVCGHRFFIRRTSEMAGFKSRIDHATQSGPLLVRRNKLHPSLRPDSTHHYTRNGVGIDTRGRAVFVWARTPLTLHAFARFFQEELACPDALYLDGNISSAWTENRPTGLAPPYVGMIGIVTPLENTQKSR